MEIIATWNDNNTLVTRVTGIYGATTAGYGIMLVNVDVNGNVLSVHNGILNDENIIDVFGVEYSYIRQYVYIIPPCTKIFDHYAGSIWADPTTNELYLCIVDISVGSCTPSTDTIHWELWGESNLSLTNIYPDWANVFDYKDSYILTNYPINDALWGQSDSVATSSDEIEMIISRTSCNDLQIDTTSFSTFDYTITITPWDSTTPYLTQSNNNTFTINDDGIYKIEISVLYHHLTEITRVVIEDIVYVFCDMFDCYEKLINKIMCLDENYCCDNCEQDIDSFRKDLNKMNAYMAVMMGYINKDQTTYGTIIDDARTTLVNRIDNLWTKIQDIIGRCECFVEEDFSKCLNC